MSACAVFKPGRPCIRHSCSLCGELFVMRRPGQASCAACRRKKPSRRRARVDELVAEVREALERLATEVAKSNEATSRQR